MITTKLLKTMMSVNAAEIAISYHDLIVYLMAQGFSEAKARKIAEKGIKSLESRLNWALNNKK